VTERNRYDNDERQNVPLSSVTSRRLLSRTGELGAPSFDFESLQLMHHFEHFTSETLLFDKPFWENHILPLALQVCRLVCVFQASMLTRDSMSILCTLS
jgi:hypothetical protein